MTKNEIPCRSMPNLSPLKTHLYLQGAKYMKCIFVVRDAHSKKNSGGGGGGLCYGTDFFRIRVSSQNDNVFQTDFFVPYMKVSRSTFRHILQKLGVAFPTHPNVRRCL